MSLKMTTGKVTLQDVARAAQILNATVLRVNGNPQVDPGVQARVLAASRQLAINLASGGKICNIALVLGECNTLRLPSEPSTESH